MPSVPSRLMLGFYENILHPDNLIRDSHIPSQQPDLSWDNARSWPLDSNTPPAYELNRLGGTLIDV